MKDRLDTQRAKARAMMPEMATGRSNLGREMSAAAPAKETVRQTSKRPMPAPSPISKAAPDRFQRPGPMTTERVAAYAQGGKVKARLAESRGMERKKANTRVAESRGMERAEMRKDLAQDKRMIAQALKADEKKDKKMMAGMIGKHEGHLHKGEPKTKFYVKGGKVKMAMGGAAKVRQGHGQKVGKMPKGGNPVY